MLILINLFKMYNNKKRDIDFQISRLQIAVYQKAFLTMCWLV